jgi:hypothetical protein
MSKSSPSQVREKSQKPSPETEATKRVIPSYVSYVVIALVMVSFSLIRLRLRDMPLERDEGEYAYAGQLILQGIAPYQLAYNMKLPGTYAACAVILAVFGQSAAGAHCGLLVVNSATILLVFLLAMRLFGSLAGAVAGASYGLLSSSEAVLGFARARGDCRYRYDDAVSLGR